jgi:integrase
MKRAVERRQRTDEMQKSKPSLGRDTMRAVPGTPYLLVRTHPSGIASYLFRYRKKGHAYKAALGRVDALPLEDARRTAQIYVGEIARDIDPIAKRKEEAERKRAQIEKTRRQKVEAAREDVFTVDAMIKAWAASRGKKDERSVRYVTATKAVLECALKPVLNLPARDISKERIEKLLDIAGKRGPAAAVRAQLAIGAAFKRAIKTGKLEMNPCATLEQCKLPPRERTPTAIEIQRIWRAAGALPSPIGEYVRFLAATATRRNEALGARWSEIELESGLWHIPKGRMKAKRPFTVPLTRAALRSLPVRGAGDFIFSMTGGDRPIGGLTRIKAALDDAIEADGAGPLAHWTLHDLRRGLATWLSDRGVDYALVNLCLAHGIPLDRSGKIYQRSYKITERRQALDMWSALLDPQPEPVRKGRKPSLRVVAA